MDPPNWVEILNVVLSTIVLTKYFCPAVTPPTVPENSIGMPTDKEAVELQVKKSSVASAAVISIVYV